MDTVLDRPWTTDSFLAWEDQQEGSHEFDGQCTIPMTGGSFAHQDIVFNLRTLLGRVLTGTGWRALHAMQLRIGDRVRFPDVVVFAGPMDQTTRTLNDAVVIFEVLSDDTATTDRVAKLIDYAQVPSLGAYVLLEQTAVAATLFRRVSGGDWIANAYLAGELPLLSLNASLPFEEIYRGLTFAG